MGVLAGQVVGDLDQAVTVARDPAQRIALAEGLDLAFLQRHRQHVAREHLPLDVLVRIDAGVVQHDGEEVAIGRGEVGDADRLALEIADLANAAGGRREQAHAAAMDAGRDLDVEAAFQRLQPAQGHADAGVGLGGRDRLE